VSHISVVGHGVTRLELSSKQYNSIPMKFWILVCKAFWAFYSRLCIINPPYSSLIFRRRSHGREKRRFSLSYLSVRHSRPLSLSFCLLLHHFTECISSAVTGRIHVKFYIGTLRKIFWETRSLVKSDKNTWHFTWSVLYFCQRHKFAIKALFCDTHRVYLKWLTAQNCTEKVLLPFYCNNG
jgi:hypothetical protein